MRSKRTILAHLLAFAIGALFLLTAAIGAITLFVLFDHHGVPNAEDLLPKFLS